MIIDCHGHYTTAPRAHTDWRKAQKEAFTAGGPPPPYPDIGDEEIRASVEGSQLKQMTERGIDLTIFDTCVYHQPGINLLFEVIETGNIVFGSEMIGAVRGVDPATGHHFDDTRRYVDALGLASGARAQVYELNARRVYPRLGPGAGVPS